MKRKILAVLLTLIIIAGMLVTLNACSKKHLAAGSTFKFGEAEAEVTRFEESMTSPLFEEPPDSGMKFVLVDLILTFKSPGTFDSTFVFLESASGKRYGPPKVHVIDEKLGSFIASRYSVEVPSSDSTDNCSLFFQVEQNEDISKFSKLVYIETETPTGTPTQNTTDVAILREILEKGEGISSVKYDMTITEPGKESFPTTIWEKGHKFREETTQQGTTTVLIIDADAGTMYSYSPDFNMAYKMNFDTKFIPWRPTANIEDILVSNPEIIGTETVDGKSCTVIRINAPQGPVKEWIWTDKGFIIKIERDYAEGISTVEYTNIDFSDIPDSMFELPEGVQIIES